MSYFDEQFKYNICEILGSGTEYTSRAIWKDTGEHAKCLKLFGLVNRYDLSNPEQLPVGTMRKLAYKSAIDEVFWIWQKKSNNIKDLKSHIWDSWADENGSIGAAYGFQVASKLRRATHEITLSDGSKKVVTNFLDQTDYVLHELIYNRYSRRIITDLYSVDQTNLMGLDPCCYSCTWGVTKDRDGRERLNLLLNQRSQDMLVANNWNVFQYAILLYAFCYATDLLPGTLTHVIADAHIYDRHIPLVKELCKNKTYGVPILILDAYAEENKDATPMEKFYGLLEDQFRLLGYKYSKFDHKIPVAV